MGSGWGQATWAYLQLGVMGGGWFCAVGDPLSLGEVLLCA